MSLLLAVFISITPPGREIIHDALLSSDAMSRGIAQFLVYIALGALVVIAALEWLVRVMISRRRARSASDI
jgi:hypothetical protein